MQIGANGERKQFDSVSTVMKQLQVGRQTLYSAIEHGYILKGFRWEFVL